MRRIRNCIVALLLGCSAPVLIWIGALSALGQARRQEPARGSFLSFACSADTDCPPGFVCANGCCIPVKR